MTGEIVQFGKYKGQPAEVLVADTGYRDWLMAQPWFRDRYPVIYQTVINYAGEPADTPEHNQMQASFLADGRCMTLARLLWPKFAFDSIRGERDTRQVDYLRTLPFVSETKHPPHPVGRRFENRGWDVTFSVERAACTFAATELSPCICRCDHTGCDADSRCRGGTVQWCKHTNHGKHSFNSPFPDSGPHYHCNPSCIWSTDNSRLLTMLPLDVGGSVVARVLVECKPDLGDDFPAVLRQVLRYDTDGHLDRRCVVVRRHQFKIVTWDQVGEMFAASGVVLLHESALDSTEWQR